MPTQLAYHYWPKWSHIWGIRVDYLSPTIYLTDILVILLITVWLISSFLNKKGTTKLYKSIKPKVFLTIPLLLLVMLNIYFSVFPQASLIKWAKILLLALLGLYIATNKQFEFKSWFIKPLSISVIFFVLIGLAQFLTGHTVGGFMYLLGERSFSVMTTGVALINIFGRQYLRAYSTFSHPNSFSGYLIVSLAFLVFSINKKDKNNRLIYIAIAAGIVGLIITFSKGVLAAVVVVALIYYISVLTKGSLRKFSLALLYLSIIISMLVSVASENILIKEVKLSEGVEKRLELNHIAGNLISKRPLLGAGLNNFIYEIPEQSLDTSVFWWLQPVHNIFLLIFSEAGIVGLLALFYLLYIVIKKARRRDVATVLSVVAILITGMFDHYWLTLQQNMLMFTFVVGLSLRKRN